MKQLPPYPGDPDSAATAINDLGQVVGISGICENAVGDQSATHALLWQNGHPINLGNLGANAWNTPVSLNNQGQIVGFANNTSNNAQAFLWTKANGMQGLPFIGDDNSSAAYDINEEGQIVGISNGGTEPYSERAFLYQNGTITDLNKLVIGDSPLYLLIAQGINDSGEIVGTAAEPDGQQVGFLAVPAYGANASDASPETSFRFASGTPPQLTGLPHLLQKRSQSK